MLSVSLASKDKEFSYPVHQSNSQKISLVHLHVLWRTCKARISDSSKDSVQTVFAKLHPLAPIAQTLEALELGRLLGFFEENIDLKLTPTGRAFGELEHWKTWQPSSAQLKILKLHRLDWVKTPTIGNRKAILDLFSGAGGLGLGFEMAGFTTAIAIDNDAQAVQAHKANFPHCDVISGDLHKIAKNPKSKLDPLLKKRDHSLAGIIGGPPCQGFSYIGERVVTDERNMLTSRFLDIVMALQPDFFVLENVAGLLTSGTRPRFGHHLAQYAKTIGPAASAIYAALPEQPDAPNRRERQYNKRLVSSAISSFQKSLPPDSPSINLLSEVRNALKLLKQHLFDAIYKVFADENRATAIRSMERMEKSMMLVAAATIVTKRIADLKKSSDFEAQKMIESLSIDESPLGEVCKHLLESYSNLEPASDYKGVSVGPVLRHLINRASSDYNVTPPKILSAAWYGAPQDRRRLFLVGVHKKLNKTFSFPSPEYFMSDEGSDRRSRKPAITCKEAIGDLPDVDRYPQLLEHDELASVEAEKSQSEFAAWMRGEQSDEKDLSQPRETWNPFVIDCCKRTTHSPNVLVRLRTVLHGVLDSTSGKTRLKPHDVAHTLRAGTREAMGSHTAVRPIHYAYDRVITVREGARLMGYPDWMTFHPTKWHGFRLVGNGVPAQLGRAIALAIKKQIYRE